MKIIALLKFFKSCYFKVMIYIRVYFILLMALFYSADALNQPLKVGMELSYPPFEMIDQKGHATGISVEIAKALAQYLNRNLQIENISFIGLIPALKTGKIDIILSSLTITEARKAAIDFSDPYLTTGLCLLASRKRSTIQNIEDANNPGIVLVVKSGTSGEAYARKHLLQPRIIILDKESACVLEVVQGKADAFIYDQFSVFTNWQKNLETTYALLNPFQKENWGIGIQKGNEEMLKQVNSFIKQFRKKGGFEKLGNRYLSKQKAAFQQLGIPFVF